MAKSTRAKTPPKTTTTAQPRRPRRRKSIDHLVPMVRSEVLRLCGGDTSRVEVLSPTEAIVR